MIDGDFDDVLACPQCKGPSAADRDGGARRCDGGRLRYPVRDGFPILRVHGAVPRGPTPLPRRRPPLPHR